MSLTLVSRNADQKKISDSEYRIRSFTPYTFRIKETYNAADFPNTYQFLNDTRTYTWTPPTDIYIAKITFTVFEFTTLSAVEADASCQIGFNPLPRKLFNAGDTSISEGELLFLSSVPFLLSGGAMFYPMDKDGALYYPYSYYIPQRNPLYIHISMRPDVQWSLIANLTIHTVPEP